MKDELFCFSPLHPGRGTKRVPRIAGRPHQSQAQSYRIAFDEEHNLPVSPVETAAETHDLSGHRVVWPLQVGRLPLDVQQVAQVPWPVVSRRHVLALAC